MGFSLMETLIAAAMIGILALIAVPQFHKFSARSRRAAGKAELAAIFTAESTFFINYNGYSAALNQIGYIPNGFGEVANSNIAGTVARNSVTERFFSTGFGDIRSEDLSDKNKIDCKIISEKASRPSKIISHYSAIPYIPLSARLDPGFNLLAQDDTLPDSSNPNNINVSIRPYLRNTCDLTTGISNPAESIFQAVAKGRVCGTGDTDVITINEKKQFNTKPGC